MAATLMPPAFLFFQYKTRQIEIEEGKSKKEIESNKLLGTEER